MQNKHPSSGPDVPNSLCPKLNEDCGPATRLKVLVVVRTVVAAARISGKDTTRETSEPTLPKVVRILYFVLGGKIWQVWNGNDHDRSNACRDRYNIFICVELISGTVFSYFLLSRRENMHT